MLEAPKLNVEPGKAGFQPKPKKTPKDEAREIAENNLLAFIKLVSPDRYLGRIHEELIRWWTRDDAKSHQLVLLPRDHMKSALIAYRVAWEITRNPSVRVLYISSTSNLASKQLGFIKQILTSDAYKHFWPDMVNQDEMKRTKWTETEICVDHPQRKKDQVRDPTVFVAGLTTGIVGMHCDIAVMDDVVVDDNAATETGREKVETQASYLASIAGADSRVWAVGTRYHPLDYYSKMQGMIVEEYNEEGEITSSYPLYETFERQVEDRGDGTGTFLWPRSQGRNGRWYGFNSQILSVKKAQYASYTNFRAQYYNDPNDTNDSSINRSMFQYYNKKYLTKDGTKWYIKDEPLNVFAAVDFAFSLSRRSDYTSIVVIGVSPKKNYYVLDVERFKTNKISDYFQKILELYEKWSFRKIRMEATAAQEVIVEDLKNNYIREYNLALSVDMYKPSRAEGTKEERIEAILQPKYANGQMWHFEGGITQLLEEELVLKRPPHDDIKDALAACVDVAVSPVFGSSSSGKKTNNVLYHPRFGGVA